MIRATLRIAVLWFLSDRTVPVHIQAISRGLALPFNSIERAVFNLIDLGVIEKVTIRKTSYYSINKRFRKYSFDGNYQL